MLVLTTPQGQGGRPKAIAVVRPKKRRRLPQPIASAATGGNNNNEGLERSATIPQSPPPPYSALAPPPPLLPSTASRPVYSPRPPLASPRPPPLPAPPVYAQAQPVLLPASQSIIEATNITELIDSFTTNLQASLNTVGNWQTTASDRLAYDSDLSGVISSKLDFIISSIDGDRFAGQEEELLIYQQADPSLRGGWSLLPRELSRSANRALTSAVTSSRSINYFAKVNHYANSKLPPYLPPLKLYLPSYPLICLAAQFSQRVYSRPRGNEREAHVDGDWRLGTKAMVIKSVPLDDMNVVVFAVRGSQTFMDWAVNLRSAPVSPQNFLDDTGNMCHAGFLSVARKMLAPVAARLRSLLEEDPSRSNCSLIMTGHSAGGAVASLLFAHMLAESVSSELNLLAGCFKRIHCITFGAPPVTLLPLSRPTQQRHRKSLFLSFINEGDPVPRADKAYVRSLLLLYSSPTPGASCLASFIPPLPTGRFNLRPKLRKTNSAPAAPLLIWRLPPGVLSNAGRLVLLRQGPRGPHDIKAEVTSDQMLRSVVFGDPLMHMMQVYASRIEVLATTAVTARVWS